ncbi:MAG: hypothetical protein GKC04_03345 [Methanomicrobiales archaeon]|nr:hypothetical protein [Methanomicrobiales archaeon]
MRDAIRGALIGAAVGDALGMPSETDPVALANAVPVFRRASRRHPNADLLPGQYTDDTQLMLAVGELLAEGSYSETAYAGELCKLHAAGKLRFPDGTVAAACEHMAGSGPEKGGIYSATAGCIAPALPFGCICADPVELRERVVKACAVTHTHPAAHAGAVAVAVLIAAAVRAHPDPVSLAWKNAILEDTTLGGKIRTAIQLEAEGISLDAALSVLGNDVTVYQTVPFSFFLIARYPSVPDLLALASHAGGNTDTIGFICGAYAGAAYGLAAFPEDLVAAVEGRGRIENLAERLYERYARKD